MAVPAVSKDSLQPSLGDPSSVSQTCIEHLVYARCFVGFGNTAGIDELGLCPRGSSRLLGSTETEAAITGGRSVTRGRTGRWEESRKWPLPPGKAPQLGFRAGLWGR